MYLLAIIAIILLGVIFGGAFFVANRLTTTRMKSSSFNRWVIVKFDDGWYGLRRCSIYGLEYMYFSLLRRKTRKFTHNGTNHRCRSPNLDVVRKIQCEYNESDKVYVSYVGDLFDKNSKSLGKTDLAVELIRC